ncbi:LTA synthase family protein [Lacticaseibacillus hulanensis]|uniref:LTA synthase family protein n=1 Tax=Lacticaseibacillus hulanensis TaxID=2493111 RepID=UPI000FD71DE6|nr:LTA synthase family protein [Lacticaseibacillus hulanensis]
MWIKTVFAYFVDFSLGPEDPLQYILMIINPLGASVIVISVGLYFKRARNVVIAGFIAYLALSALLLANALYYREFTDFITINTVLALPKVMQGLGASGSSMMAFKDLVLILDIIIVAVVLIAYAALNIWRYIQHEQLIWPTFGIHLDDKPAQYHLPQATTVVGIALFMVTLAVSELNRPQLLSRTFDRSYIVKYLGFAPFTIYDGIKTAQTNTVRSSADSADTDKVIKFVRKNYAQPSSDYFGAAKGKNVIIIHLESFQEFLIGQKINGREVTPFLNSLIKDKNTLSFSNMFNQVGLGKTSDAENMLESGTFGINNGSLFSTLGSTNTFQSAPAILDQTAGYTSAVMHGGKGSFWNRSDTYQNMGYQYYFDGDYYAHSTDMDTQYGIKDKLMFAESAKYLEHLQQPFYAKIITTSNHDPYTISAEDSDFPDAGTDDKTVNSYFKTANYLDSALKEFFTYLKESGLYKNSLIMMYGDHYGIGNSRNKDLAPLLGKSAETWSDFDNVQMQRIPLIFNMPGLKGGQKTTYGGEIDILPTLLHLLGLNTKQYVQFGTDLLSPSHKQVVAQRNGNFITPNYTVVNGTPYVNNGAESGREATNLTPATTKRLKADQEHVNTELRLSDTVANKNLLRFYTPAGFTPVNGTDTDFNTSLQRLLTVERNASASSTSEYSKNNNEDVAGKYKSDAPELKNNRSVLTEYPAKVAKQAVNKGNPLEQMIRRAKTSSFSN